MECLLQYLDDIDDMVGALGLVFESIRRILLGLCAALLSASMIASGVWLALLHPPLALATCMLLFVTLLYRTVTSPARGHLQTS
ncbi:MAG: hypothetical protein WBN07_16690 [Woeseiaceae bacterium]